MNFMRSTFMVYAQVLHIVSVYIRESQGFWATLWVLLTIKSLKKDAEELHKLLAYLWWSFMAFATFTPSQYWESINSIL